MKEIKSIIRPFKLDDVIMALHKIEELPGITISKIKGFGKSKAKDSASTNIGELQNFVEKIKLEIVVHDEIVDEIVDAIQKVAYTGNPGDGKIFVIDVNETIKIRTNERGEIAI